MIALWKTVDNKEFKVEGLTLAEIRNKINKLRKEHNISKPSYMDLYGPICKRHSGKEDYDRIINQWLIVDKE